MKNSSIRFYLCKENIVIFLLGLTFFNSICLSMAKINEWEGVIFCCAVIKISSILVLLFLFFKKKFTLESIFVLFIIVILIIITLIRLGVTAVDGWILTVLFLFLLKDIDLKKSALSVERGILFGLLLMFILVIIGLNKKIYMASNHSFLVYRYHFGIGHPNGLSHFIFLYYVSRLLRKEGDICKGDLLLGLVISIFILVFPNSRVYAVMVFLCAITYYIFFQKIKTYKNQICKWMYIMSLFVVFISTLYTILGNRYLRFWYYIDTKFLNSKLFHSYFFAKVCGIRWFGSEILKSTIVGKFAGEAVWFDNQFGFFLVKYGIVFTIFFEIIYIYSLKRGLANQKFGYIIAMFFFTILSYFQIEFEVGSASCLILLFTGLLYTDNATETKTPIIKKSILNINQKNSS